MPRLFAAVVLAVALLLAPTGTAVASGPVAGNHAMAAMADHCSKAAGSTTRHKAMDCCVAACTATAAMIAQLSLAWPPRPSTAQSLSADRIGRSALAELPTPPPRAQ